MLANVVMQLFLHVQREKKSEQYGSFLILQDFVLFLKSRQNIRQGSLYVLCCQGPIWVLQMQQRARQECSLFRTYSSRGNKYIHNLHYYVIIYTITYIL